jgi:hypothetical protein
MHCRNGLQAQTRSGETASCQTPSPAITPLNPTIIRSELRGRGAGLDRWPQSITATMVHDV